jgi:zinc transporter ZupT
MPDYAQFSTSFTMSILAAAVASAGILVMRYTPAFRNNKIDYFTSFAAGILLTAAFLHIIPEALEIYADSAIYIAIGYFAMYLINRLLSSYVCHEHMHPKDECPEGEHSHAHLHNKLHHSEHSSPFDARLGIMSVIGIGTHSFIDGIVYSVTFTHSIYTGLLASVGLVLHEFAEGAVTYTLLISAGIKPKKAMIVALFTAALTTPMGMLVSYPFVHHLQGETLAILLALSGGSLIYVGASHLIPHTEKEPLRFSFVAVLAGVLTAVLIGVTGGEHGHGGNADVHIEEYSE